MNKKMVLTLFSSDSSQQYKKDVLNVIAAPYNSEYRFRYKKEYIEENVESYLSDKSANNKRAIIVYRTNSDKSEVDPFMVPVRWCKIKKIDYENDICIITFVVKEYPQFSSDFLKASMSREANIKYTSDYFKEKNIDNYYVLPYAIKAVSLNSIKPQQDGSNWINIADALNKHETFSNTLFFQTSLPTKINSSTLKIKEHSQKTVIISHYCCEDIDNYNADLSIECNNDIIQPVTEKHLTLDCRYDKVPHIFEAKKSTGYSKTQIIFNIKSVNKPINEDETKIIIPVKTKRKWRNRLFKSIFSFLSVISLTLIASWGTFSSEDVEKNLLIYIILIIGALAAPLSNLIFGEE